jgi:hypothetical protein
METAVPQHHPLRQLFSALTERNFTEALGWPDFNVTDYLANLLVEFVHIDRLHCIQNQQGKTVETVVELLFESEAHDDTDSSEREREVHRHIGDFTLFIAGLFPEYLSYLKSGGMIYHKDHLVDYMKAGKRSYSIVAASQPGEANEQPALFQKLSSNFELCVTGLGFVREDLNRMGHPPYQESPNLLLH